MKLHFVFLIALLLLLPALSRADYNVDLVVASGGAGDMEIGSYTTQFTVGQSMEVGEGEIGDFTAHYGFWPAVVGANWLDFMHLSIRLVIPAGERGVAELTWDQVEGATRCYYLYRGTTPTFSAYGSSYWQYLPSYVDRFTVYQGIGDPESNYYYRGRAASDTQTSPPSNIVGEFDFATEGLGAGCESDGNPDAPEIR